MKSTLAKLRLIGSACASMLAMLSLVGCSSVSPRNDIPFAQDAVVENRPFTPPTRSVSGFTEALSCMDRMLLDYRIPKTYVASKFIADSTGKLGVGTKEMIITALNNMSRASGTFSVVDYETEALRNDTVGLLTDKSQIPIPQFYVSGALTSMDQNVVTQRESLGGTLNNILDIGVSKDRMVSSFSLDLHLGDVRTRTLFPGIVSNNQILVANAAAGLDAGGRIKKAGVQFSMGREVSQGTGVAVRTLVELSMVELIGQWARVPYWQCLALNQTHPEFQYQLNIWWNAMSASERVKLFQTGLRGRQFFFGPADGRPSAALRDALMRFQAAQNLVVTGNINFETYERLVQDHVVFNGDGHFVRTGWGDPARAVAAAKSGVATQAPTSKESDSLVSNLKKFDSQALLPVQIQLDLNDDDGKLNVGDFLVAGIVVDRPSWVYCFYKDGRGRVSQIYPNPLQRQQPVPAQRRLSVPDMQLPQTFTINMTRPGEEELGCFATEKDPRPELPPEFKGPALTPLAYVQSVADVHKAFSKAFPRPAALGVTIRKFVIAG